METAKKERILFLHGEQVNYSKLQENLELWDETINEKQAQNSLSLA